MRKFGFFVAVLVFCLWILGCEQGQNTGGPTIDRIIISNTQNNLVNGIETDTFSIGNTIWFGLNITALDLDLDKVIVNQRSPGQNFEPLEIRIPNQLIPSDFYFGSAIAEIAGVWTIEIHAVDRRGRISNTVRRTITVSERQSITNIQHTRDGDDFTISWNEPNTDNFVSLRINSVTVHNDNNSTSNIRSNVNIERGTTSFTFHFNSGFFTRAAEISLSFEARFRLAPSHYYTNVASYIIELPAPPPLTFTVVFHDSFGNELGRLENVEYGSLITQPDDPVENGLAFLGWRTSAANITGGINDWNFTQSTVLRDVNLFANWRYVSEVTNIVETGSLLQWDNPTDRFFMRVEILSERGTVVYWTTGNSLHRAMLAGWVNVNNSIRLVIVPGYGLNRSAGVIHYWER